jgi:hypothetical protein
MQAPDAQHSRYRAVSFSRSTFCMSRSVKTTTPNQSDEPVLTSVGNRIVWAPKGRGAGLRERADMLAKPLVPAFRARARPRTLARADQS